MKDVTGADVIIHALDAPMLSQISASASRWGLAADDSPPPDRTVAEGDIINFGNLSLKVIHTPGHTQGGISFYADGCVFVGDTLFAGSIGRTDFEGGHLETLLASIREKLFRLADDTRVLTGHGPETTIGSEKQYNPFARLG